MSSKEIVIKRGPGKSCLSLIRYRTGNTISERRVKVGVSRVKTII